MAYRSSRGMDNEMKQVIILLAFSTLFSLLAVIGLIIFASWAGGMLWIT